MKELEFRLPHSLSADEIRDRMDRAVVMAREHYADSVGPIEAQWSDNVMTVRVSAMGMEFNAEVESVPGELLVRVRLPVIASLFAGRIREGIEDRLGRLIAS